MRRKTRPISPDFVSRQEAAYRLMLSPRQIDRLIRDGKLQKVMVSANCSGIPRAAFEEYLGTRPVVGIRKKEGSAARVQLNDIQKFSWWSGILRVRHRTPYRRAARWAAPPRKELPSQPIKTPCSPTQSRHTGAGRPARRCNFVRALTEALIGCGIADGDHVMMVERCGVCDEKTVDNVQSVAHQKRATRLIFCELTISAKIYVS